MSDPSLVHDLVCIGFGPAALAVAAGIEDNVLDRRLPDDLRSRVVFLEKAESTIWQGGLLLPGTNINHSHFRDLACPRDPGSRFTFAQYLKKKGRLYEFGLWAGAASRIEWSDYVGWAAEKLSPYARYGEAGLHVEPSGEGSAVDTLRVRSSKGDYLARRVMLACGMEPYTPPPFDILTSDRARHSQNYLYYRPEIDALVRETGGPVRVAVVGSGLSAAEIILDLLARYEPDKIHVTSLHRGLPFRYYDMSQFSNRIYMPPEVDRFYYLPEGARREMFQKTWATNFSGVDGECASMIWNTIYERRVQGIDNFNIFDRYTPVGADWDGEALHLRTDDSLSGRPGPQLEADFCILCTGFRDTLPDRILAPLENMIERESDGLLAIDYDYRLKTKRPLRAPIYLNGHCEHTHGIATTQSFSLVAEKAERILNSLYPELARSASVRQEAGRREHLMA